MVPVRCFAAQFPARRVKRDLRDFGPNIFHVASPEQNPASLRHAVPGTRKGAARFAPRRYGPDLIDRWKGRAFQSSPDSSISVVASKRRLCPSGPTSTMLLMPIRHAGVRPRCRPASVVASPSPVRDKPIDIVVERQLDDFVLAPLVLPEVLGPGGNDALLDS